jgi:hypothetical protein
MPKFVWEITSRGAWAPQLFHGELPREMTLPHNAGRYVMHDVKGLKARMMEGIIERGASALDYLAHVYPPPPPFTGKEKDDAV